MNIDIIGAPFTLRLSILISIGAKVHYTTPIAILERTVFQRTVETHVINLV